MNSLDITPPDHISKTETMARGHEALLAATSDRLPSHPTKDGRPKDSCFGLIGAHQCGVLMVLSDVRSPFCVVLPFTNAKKMAANINVSPVILHLYFAIYISV